MQQNQYGSPQFPIKSYQRQTELAGTLFVTPENPHQNTVLTAKHTSLREATEPVTTHGVYLRHVL